MSEDGGETIERRANANEPRLVVLVEAEHVETIGGDVVRSTRERHHPEEEQRPLQPEMGGQCERYTAEGSADEQLHGRYPPALGLDKVDKRTPQWLNDPRQIEPRGVECDFSIRQSELFVEHDGDGHHRHIGQALGEIERGNPCPGRNSRRLSRSF